MHGAAGSHHRVATTNLELTSKPCTGILLGPALHALGPALHALGPALHALGPAFLHALWATLRSVVASVAALRPVFRPRWHHDLQRHARGQAWSGQGFSLAGGRSFGRACRFRGQGVRPPSPCR